MFVPMIFLNDSFALKCWTAFLNPAGPLSAIHIDQSLNIPNALPLRDNSK
jgi:hypothetical protein